jgi:cell division protein FtsB
MKIDKVSGVLNEALNSRDLDIYLQAEEIKNLKKEIKELENQIDDLIKENAMLLENLDKATKGEGKYYE